jgi:metal-dependent amidase/aminoacylase/carboxypeptidase family protein
LKRRCYPDVIRRPRRKQTASLNTGHFKIPRKNQIDPLEGHDAGAGLKVLQKEGPGESGGHNLLGSGAALAAVALKEYMERNHVAGTLRYYGTPAEEGGDGKVYMIRAGLFRDVDVVLQWHPDSKNAVFNGGMLAINSARFLFHGVAAHAALAPERGRSALDAVMLMGKYTSTGSMKTERWSARKCSRCPCLLL